MAKSVKQQMYEQLANQHVQQALNNIGMQQFQDAYNQWNAEQDGLAEFQAAYNAWSDANPIQTVSQPKAKAQTIPVLNAPDTTDFFKPKTASGIDVNAQAAKDIDRHAFNEAYARQQQQEQMLSGRTIKPDDIIAKYAKARGITEDQARQEYEKAEAMKSQSIEKPGNIEIDTQAQNDAKVASYLDTSRKLTEQEKKDARALAQEELQKFEYGPNKRPVLNTPEDRQRYADAVNLLNKTNKLSNALTGAIRQPLNLARAIRDVAGPASKANSYGQVDASMDKAYENAKTQNPGATTAGEIGGQLAMYALTNPLFDSLGAAAGLGKAGSFALNQVGQNLQDVALDTLPTLNSYREGGISDEERAAILRNIGANAAGNLIMGAAGEGLSALAKNRAAKNAADAAFRTNASEGAERLARLAEEGYISPQKLQADEIASLNMNPVDANNKQFSELMNTFNNQFKDESAMRNIFTPEDLDASQNAQFKQLMEENLIPERLNPVADIEGLEALREAEDLKVLENEYANMWGSEDVPKLAQPEPPKVDTTGPRPQAMDQGVSPAIENEAEALAKQMDAKEIAAEQAENVVKPQRAPVDEINNPRLTDEERDLLNGGIFELESPLRQPKVEDAVGNLYTKVTSDEGITLVDKYQGLSYMYRKATDADEAKAIVDQLAELKKTINNVDASERAIVKDIFDYNDVENAIADYKIALNGEDIGAVEKAAKTLDAARNRIARRKGADPVLKKTFGGDYGPKVKRPLNNFPYSDVTEEDLDDIVNSWVEHDLNKPNRFVKDAEPDRTLYPKKQSSSVPGADQLQFFADGGKTNQWKTSKARLNTFENQGWGDNLPKKNYAYRVFTEMEQNEEAIQRGQSYLDLLYKENYDAPDVKAAMTEIQSLMDGGRVREANDLARKLAFQGRESGRTVQAFAEYNKDSFAGALGDAHKFQDDEIIQPWVSKNQKAVDGNKRIAQALSDMGNKWKGGKGKVALTHDQIREGVIAEIEKEVGSIEGKFNDNDIEYLTMLAEDKSIPVWQITSELEHKLNTGNWYTLDESTPLPKPTNGKLQSALNSLIEGEVRAETPKPSLKEITEQVKNTLAKESANFDGQFSDDDIQYIANLINEGASKSDIVNALNTKLATGSFGISDETLQEVNNIFKQISNYDPNSKQFVEGQLQAYKLLADEIVGDATALEKYEAWRYLAMLGNPKTMLRNFFGNQMFGVVTGISNNMAALAEAGIDKGIKALGGEGIQRTKSIINPIKDGSLLKAAYEDADASRYRQMIGSKYEKFGKDTLRQQKSVFNNKLLQLYEKATDAGISDYQAVKNKFTTSLAGYLKANGYDKSIFDAETELARLKNLGETQVLSDAQRQSIEQLTKDVDALEKARDYALKQAEYATFHEDNAFAKWLSEASRKAPKPIRAMIEGIVPFKKTPANVLRSGYEYSPLGAISSLKKTGKLIYENTGKRAGNLADTYVNSAGKEVQKTLANDVIESWSKTLTGTALAAMGAYLYDKGVLLDSNKDTKYQDQLEGLQNYSIKIGDKTYTVDWAAPAVMPLLLGAEVKKVMDSSGNDTENWYEHLDEYLNAANMIAEPIVETSMLSGIRDTLKEMASTAKTGDYEGLLANAAYQAGTGYLSQAIPTLSGQIARTVDNTRRSTYSDKEGVAGTLEKQGRKLMNKIPGLSQLNQPYVDTYGREQKNSPFESPLANLAYQMTSPGYLANVNTTDADIMSREVYNINKNEKTLPEWQSYFKDSEGKRVSPDEYTTAARAYGQANYEIRNELANDEWFKGLDDAQKEEIVKGINGISEHVGKAAIDPEYETTSKAYNAYKEGGIPSLIDYYKGESAKSTLKEMGDVKSTSTAGKEALELIKEGKTDEAQAVIDTAEAFQIYGKDNAGYAYKRYEATKQKIPSLTVDAYMKVVDKMDGLDDGKKNGQISQKEMLAYLNKGSYSESEAQSLWTQYGNDWSYVLGKNKEGKWTAKKKK